MDPAEATPFRRALPLLAVSLVNKVASVGVSLLPVLVVERGLPPGEAAFVLGASRAASVLGTLGGGVLADRHGAKRALLVSFGAAAVGVAGMAVPGDTALLVATAGVANAGLAMFPVASRLLLAATVPGAEQKEAVAWLRTVANLGLAVSFTVSGLLGGERLVPLLLLDAAMSVAALALGAAWLPARDTAAATPAGGAGRWPTFLAMTLLVTCWNGAYEAYLASCAALLRTALGPDGVRVFSAVMVANTVGCTALGVAVTRGIARPDRSVPAGFALLLVGAVVGTGGDAAGALVGVTVVTVGELLWAATAQYVWMGLLPAGPRRSTTFAVAMAATFLARAAGAAAVFPVVLASPSPRLAMGLLVLPGLLLSLLAGPIWADVRRVGAVR
jgi:MFS family permease